MIEVLRRWRDAIDRALEALERLPEPVLAALGTHAPGAPVKAPGRPAAAPGTTTTRPNGSATPGWAASHLGGASGLGATCRHCGGRFEARRRGGPEQVYCGRTCRQRHHAKARRERADGASRIAEAAPDTTVLPDRIDRPFRSPTRYHGDQLEAVREREKHLQLPTI
jgi:hypothetical protein